MSAFLHRSAVLGVAALVVAACGGSGDDSPDAMPSDSVTELAVTSPPDTEPDVTQPISAGETEPTSPAVTGTTEPDGDGIDAFDEIRPAVIQLDVMGTIRDPEIGLAWGGGRGSGFIISADGLAVTNNHVVTGAATIEVFIGGDDSQGYNATIVGVSECNDLALIQLATDEALPYLDWAGASPPVGTEIYAAGFPLGDPEYTLTRGIVAKADTEIADYIVAIDSAVEHDANLQPGNSGGPLVDVNGHLVGVNFYASARTNTSQFFAISSPLAQRVIDDLRDGDFESLGINGVAIADEASGISGVWVRGTAPGSPASDAGILPGDIVTSMNGLPMAMDGTISDYCDVIRTAGDRPISVEVLRFDTQEVLRGEINGDLPIEQVLSFAEEIDDDVDVAAGPTEGYAGYRTLVDDTGTMTVDVPTNWTDVDTVPFDDESPWISASPSLESFYATFDDPGVIMVAGEPIPDDQIPAAIAEWVSPGACAVDEGLAPYEDGAFVGQYQLLGECGGVGAAQVFLAANANDGRGAVLIGVQMVTEADFEALDTVIATFNLLG